MKVEKAANNHNEKLLFLPSTTRKLGSLSMSRCRSSRLFVGLYYILDVNIMLSTIFINHFLGHDVPPYNANAVMMRLSL